MKFSILSISFVIVATIISCMNVPVQNGSYPLPKSPGPSEGVLFNNMLGVNAYEWNFLQSPDNRHNTLLIYEPKMELIKSFSQVRHYMDWEKIEPERGEYTFNPTRKGGWNYDAIYQRCKVEGIDVVACLKSSPDWLLKTYPQAERDAENVPAPYGSNLSKPASYILQAKAAFQFAARYGSNKDVDSALVIVSNRQRWTNDPRNEKKIGLGYIKFIECDNERDKWWKGKSTKQSAEEYAANLSAFYDGDKGRLGAGVGVKSADPNMLVVMGGLATADVTYVKKIVEWCKANRGYKKDGELDLCFDVINYHYYANNASSIINADHSRGLPPELTAAGEVARQFLNYSNEELNGMQVWITELGYDINPESKQSAKTIGTKSALEVQADWMIRSCLFYARTGISRLFFYQLYDDTSGSGSTYATSGLLGEGKRRPAADYILQSGKLLKGFRYHRTLHSDPIVDEYVNGRKKIYVLTVPDEKGRTENFTLNLSGVNTVNIHSLVSGADEMRVLSKAIKDKKLDILVTETPVFVEVVN